MVKPFPVRLLLSGVLAALACKSPASAATIELDLASALNRAPEANFQILLSQEGLEAQTQATRIARSGLLPQVSLSASQSRSMSPNVDAFFRSIPGVPTRTFADRFDAVIRARMALLSTRAWDDWKLSRLSLQATELQIRNTIESILQQIAVNYYSHWRNQRRLDVIDANLERDSLLLKIARDQESAGVATALDVTRAEVRLANNELARLQQETAVLQSSLNLKRILNLPMEADLVISDGLIGYGDNSSAFSALRLDQILAQRADYQQLLTALQREELAVKATRRDRLPSLELSGQWGYASESWSDDMEEQWNVQLGFSMPVFEGFRLDAQQRVAASEARQRELELTDLRQQIEADYRLIHQTLQSSMRQVEVARRAVQLNVREYELARIRFEEGVADNSDVVSAMAALADAEDALVEAEFQYVQAQIALARVEGNVRAILQ